MRRSATIFSRSGRVTARRAEDASATVSFTYSATDLPPTRTARLSGRRRAPLQDGQDRRVR